MVWRRSFHICGWRFPGFSEVNAGSAPCRQIRFTSDLSNRLCCPLAATAAACQYSFPEAGTEAGPKLPHAHGSSCPLSEISAR